MELFPAIDLRGGRVVRLHQGDFDKETAYGADPVAVAEAYAAAGARWIHVVDLDAARTAIPVNRPVIAAIAAAVGSTTNVQASGGIRDRDAAESLAAAGVHRVVLGTAAVENPSLVRDLAELLPVALAVDTRGRDVAVRGWTKGSGVDLFDLLDRFAGSALAAVIVTDISRDSTLAGPDLEGLAEMLAATQVPVIASGGVGSLADLRILAGLQVDGQGLAGTIVGKALYEGRFTVTEGIDACAR